MLHYVFGYGSLVDKKSREITITTNSVFPCILNDKFVRFWTYHPKYKDEIVLGIVNMVIHVLVFFYRLLNVKKL